MSIQNELLSLFNSGFWLTAELQLLAVSVGGFVAVKLAARKSAPVRSLVAAVAMVALALTLAVSMAFQLSHLSWYEAKISGQALRIFSSRPPALQSPALPAASGEIASVVKAPAPAKHHFSVFNVSYRQLGSFVAPLWLAGALFMLARLAYGLHLLGRFKRSLAPVQDESLNALLHEAARKFNRSEMPSLCSSPIVESPIAIGISKPLVIIPESLLGKLSAEEMKSIILHELAHIYSGDHLAGVFKRLVLAANWWNPLAYAISDAHSAAREEVADSYVLTELQPKEYSKCLAGLAEKACLINRLPGAAGMAGGGSSLEQRIKSILSKKGAFSMTTGNGIKIAAIAVCVIAALAFAGIRIVQASKDEAPNKPPSLKKAQEQNPLRDALQYLKAPQVKKDIEPKGEAEKKNFASFQDGVKLPEAAAMALEQKQAQGKASLDEMSLLLYYYASRFMKAGDNSASIKKSVALLFNLIQNYPEAEIFSGIGWVFNKEELKTAERLWAEQIKKNPDNLKILLHASNTIQQQDLGTAIRCLQKGKELDPKNLKWPAKLGTIYMMVDSKKALPEFETAYALCKDEGAKIELLCFVCDAAVNAGESKKAEKYAHELLDFASKPDANEKYKDAGYLTFTANNCLGLLAMKDGNVDEAEKHLLASAKTGHSSHLFGWGGPQCLLAAKLFDAGRKDSVIKFFEESAGNFQGQDDSRDIVAAIKRGETPFVTPLDANRYPHAILLKLRRTGKAVASAKASSKAAVVAKESQSSQAPGSK